MCFPIVPRPYIDYRLKDPPKKKEEKKEEEKEEKKEADRFIVLQEGAQFYKSEDPFKAPVFNVNTSSPKKSSSKPKKKSKPSKPAPKPAPKTQQYVPYKETAAQQFWCREISGLYTLRTIDEIQKDLQPGYWKTGDQGVPYFVRMST